MELKIDADFESCLPMLSTAEYNELEKSIVKDGVLTPVLVWNGIIIDGHNRYKICKAHRIENIPTKEMDFFSKDEVIEWILRNQLGRRNLTDVQRNEVALKYEEVIAKQMKEKMLKAASKGGKAYSPIDGSKGKSNWSDPSETATTKRKELAKIAGTSEGSIQRTKFILENGTPEQIDRARKGGKGNSQYAIVNEIKSEQKGDEIETRKCKKCGRILPITEFYGHHPNSCKQCYSSLKTERDIKGRKIDILPELRGMTAEEIIGDLYDTDKVIEFTDDDLKEELVALIDNFSWSAQNCLNIHKELINNEESKEKVLSNLTLLQHEIQKWKEVYNYE